MKTKRISAAEAGRILEVSATQARVYFRAGMFRTARKDRGTRWTVERAEVIATFLALANTAALSMRGER